MALVQIKMASSGRVIWAKLSQAAKLIEANQARYVAVAAAAEPEAVPELAVSPAAPKSAPKGRRR